MQIGLAAVCLAVPIFAISEPWRMLGHCVVIAGVFVGVSFAVDTVGILCTSIWEL